MAFTDRFSHVAPDYARFRPRYPRALFEHLAALCPRRERAWDCAAGSGQASAGLAERFLVVVATDPSRAQLAAGGSSCYLRAACTAERCCLADASVDLVTVGQALHWLDTGAFYDEARRVARPGALLAVWSYALCRIDPAVDRALDRLHGGVLKPYWSPARAHVESGYRTLPFPFDEVGPHPPLDIVRPLRRGDLEGYVATWSAVSAARRAGIDPLPDLSEALRRAWPDVEEVRTARWPIALRVGRVR